MFQSADLNIRYRVKDLLRTMDFYNILLGNSSADIYEGHAIYFMKRQRFTLTFIEDPGTTKLVCGNFQLLFNSDDDVYERVLELTRNGFGHAIKVDHKSYSPDNHAFSVEDPNGIHWYVGIKEKNVNNFKFFNFPRVNTVWDILKPL